MIPYHYSGADDLVIICGCFSIAPLPIHEFPSETKYSQYVIAHRDGNIENTTEMRHRPRCASSDKDNPISSKCLKELEQQQAAVRSAYESLTPSKSTWLQIRTFVMKLHLQDYSLSRKQLGLLEDIP